jgi:hypothetical protein
VEGEEGEAPFLEEEKPWEEAATNFGTRSLIGLLALASKVRVLIMGDLI